MCIRDRDKILAGAIEQAECMLQDSVLVVSQADWNHGIVGIVAAKLLEKYKKPTYVLPVSYTHLDVYKRQVLGYPLGCCEQLAGEWWKV